MACQKPPEEPGAMSPSSMQEPPAHFWGLRCLTYGGCYKLGVLFVAVLFRRSTVFGSHMQLWLVQTCTEPARTNP